MILADFFTELPLEGTLFKKFRETNLEINYYGGTSKYNPSYQKATSYRLATPNKKELTITNKVNQAKEQQYTPLLHD